MDMILRGPRWRCGRAVGVAAGDAGRGVQTVGDLAELKQTVGPTTLLPSTAPHRGHLFESRKT